MVDAVSSDEDKEKETRYLQQDPQTRYVQVIYNQLSNYTTSDPTIYDDLYVATNPYAQRASQDAYIANLQSLSNFYDGITSIGSVRRRRISSDDDDSGSSISLAPSSSPPITSLTPPPSLPPSISSPPTTTFKCFGADDGGEFSVLYNAVRAYVV